VNAPGKVDSRRHSPAWRRDLGCHAIVYENRQAFENKLLAATYLQLSIINSNL